MTSTATPSLLGQRFAAQKQAAPLKGKGGVLMPKQAVPNRSPACLSSCCHEQPHFDK